MKRRARVFLAGAPSVAALFGAVLAALVLSIPAFAQDGKAMVRVAHLSPDVPNVDVYVNDEPVGALSGVSFGTVSPYFSLPAGTQNVKIHAADDASKPLIEADLDLRGGEAYTLGAVGLVEDGSLTAQVYEDDNTLPARGKARLRVVHAAPDVASVDVAPDRRGEALFADLGFPNATSYEEVPTGTYTLEVRAAGTDLPAFSIPGATLSTGVVYTAFVAGLAEEGTLRAVVSSDAGASGRVRRTATLDVAAGSVPTASTPETGGVPLAPLLYGAAFLVAGLGVARLRAVRHRRDRSAPPTDG